MAQTVRLTNDVVNGHLKRSLPRDNPESTSIGTVEAGFKPDAARWRIIALRCLSAEVRPRLFGIPRPQVPGHDRPDRQLRFLGLSSGPRGRRVCGVSRPAKRDFALRRGDRIRSAVGRRTAILRARASPSRASRFVHRAGRVGAGVSIRIFHLQARQSSVRAISSSIPSTRMKR